MAELPSTPSFFDRQFASLRASRTTLSFALILGVIALGSRLWAIADKSLWLDEVLSWRAARVSPSDLADYVGAHPPLYFGLLHLWVNIAGGSEAALRAPSAIAGAATIILLALVASRVGGVLLSATAAVLLLLNSTHLYFSQEARMYAPMGLLSLAATVALAAFIMKPSLYRLAAYAALALCVIYTHYSGFVVVAAHGCVIAGYGFPKLWRDRNPSLLGGGLFAFALMWVAYLPWLSNFRQAERLGVPHMPEPTWSLAWNTLQGALGLERAPSMWLWLLPAIPLLVFGIYGIARRWRDPLAVSLGALAFVPIGQLLISVQVTPIFSLRQISPYVPALVFVLALGFVDALGLIRRFNLPARLAGAALVMVVAGLLLSFLFKGFTATYTAPPLEDWRAAAADLQGFDGPIYITAVYMLDPFTYYYGNQPNAHSFGLWSPEALQVGQTAMIGISHQSEQSVLTALGSNVNIEGPRIYPGVKFYKVRLLHHTALNVHVPLDQTGAGWSVNAYGYLQTGRDFSSFTCTCTLDANGDGRADEPFTVAIEYFDAGTAPLRLFGPTAGAVLASQPMSNTLQWQTANVALPIGTPVGQTFGLSGGVTLRRLQVIRTQLQSVDLFGSYQGGTRWILRADGYIQSTDGYSYIDSMLPIDADKDGAIDQPFVFELEYGGGDSRPPKVFGLEPGSKFTPVQQDAHVIRSNGEWHTIQIVVAKGERLQPRFFVGRDVLVRRVAFLPPVE